MSLATLQYRRVHVATNNVHKCGFCAAVFAFAIFIHKLTAQIVKLFTYFIFSARCTLSLLTTLICKLKLNCLQDRRQWSHSMPAMFVT